MNTPILSIAVLSYNRCAELSANLNIIREIESRISAEVIIVDNASTDGTVELLSSFVVQNPLRRIVYNNRNNGVAAGRNQAFRLARGSFIVCLDDDAHISADGLQSMPEVFRRYENAGALAFRVRHGATHEPQNIHGDKACIIGNFHGAGHAFRREVFSTVGYLDEECTYGGEEIDICIRMHDHGYMTWYTPGIVVDHFSKRRADVVEVDRRKKWVFNYTRVLYKHFPGRMAATFAARHLLSHVIAAQREFGIAQAGQIVRSAANGRRMGLAVHKTVRRETVEFYGRSSTRPEYGNVPLLRKVVNRLITPAGVHSA